MKKGFKGIFVLVALVAATGSGFAQGGGGEYSVEIDLQQQMAYLIRGRHVVMASPVSTGRAGHFTETGNFKIIEKERDHYSSMYGKIVDAAGNTIVQDADKDMLATGRVRSTGGNVQGPLKFVPAPMHYFMRFHGATGMHAGYLPGYPASHGCVRMPEDRAIAFFNRVEIGTPVRVFGRTPRTRDYYTYGPQPLGRPRIYQGRPVRPGYDPRFAPPPRYANPWWR